MTDALYEYFNTGDDATVTVYGKYWRAQTFTVGASNHIVTYIRLYAFRASTPGTCTVSIRAVDGSSHPTGTDLTSGSVDASGWTTSADWRTITLTRYNLSASTTYAIVVRATSGTASKNVSWREKAAGGYTGGAGELSSDSGGSWETQSYDFLFEVYGQTQKTKTYTSDLLLKSLGLSKTYTIDAIVKGLLIPKTYTADSLIKVKSVPKTYSTDSMIKALSVPKTYFSDSIIKKYGDIKAYNIDMIIPTLIETYTKEYGIDVLIKKLSASKTYEIDTLVKSSDGYFKTLCPNIAKSGMYGGYNFGPPYVSTGKIGGSFYCNGVQEVNINGGAGSKPYFGTGAFAYIAWVKTEGAYANNHGIYADGSANLDSNTAGVAFVCGPTSIYVVIGDGANHLQYDTGLTTFDWTLLGVTRDASGNVYLIINNVITNIGTFTGSIDSGSSVTVGYTNRGGFHGWIDEYREYSRVLTQSDVDKLYALYNVTDANHEIWFRFEPGPNVRADALIKKLLDTKTYELDSLINKLSDSKTYTNNVLIKGTGNTKIIDTSCYNRYDATIYGTPDIVDGKQDKGIYFNNGSSEYIELGSAAVQDALGFGTGAFTYIMWLKTESYPTPDGGIFRVGNSSLGNNQQGTSLGSDTSESKLFWRISNGTDNLTADMGVDIFSEWKLLGLTRDNSGNVYSIINDTLTSVGTYTGDITVYNLMWLGRCNSGFFKGYIDEFRAYNRVFTQSDVDKVYNLEQVRDSLRLEYRFEPGNAILFDVLIKKLSEAKTYGLDSILQYNSADKSYSIDMIIPELTNIAKDYAIDILIHKLSESEAYGIDALITKLYEYKDYNIDAIVKMRDITKTYGIDILVKKLMDIEEYGIDINISIKDDVTYISDVLIKKTNNSKPYDIDSFIKKLSDNKSYELDSLLKKTSIDKSYSIDNLIQRLSDSKSYTIDMIIPTLGEQSKEYGIDLLIKKLSESKLYTSDILIKKLLDYVQYGADSLVYKKDDNKIYTSDTIVKMLSEFKAYTSDSMISKKYESKIYTIDDIIIAIDSKIYAIDMLIKKLSIYKEYTSDSIIFKTDSKIYELDSLIKKLSASKTYGIDAIIDSLEGILKNYDIDVFIKKSSDSKAYNLDSIIKKLRISITYGLDGIIYKKDSKSYISDILLNISDYESYGSDVIIAKFRDIEQYDIDSIIVKLRASKAYPLDLILEDTILPGHRPYYVDFILVYRIDGDIDRLIEITNDLLGVSSKANKFKRTSKGDSVDRVMSDSSVKLRKSKIT